MTHSTNLSEEDGRCGYAGLVGRPNVGKSTLLNRLVGQKLAATTRRPQTTRNRLLGVVTRGQHQLLLVDTPGIHRACDQLLNRTLNQTALSCLSEVDVNLFVIVAGQWQAQDAVVLRYLVQAGKPIILVVNKLDGLKRRQDVLPFIDHVQSFHSFAEIVPVSAKQGTNVVELETVAMAHLPIAPIYFAPDEVTDRSLRFIVAELVREQLMERLGEELPYVVAVVVDRFADEGRRLAIDATIWVPRESHKPMVIGAGGHRLKTIGREARYVIERELERPVFLRLWVQVKSNWLTDPNAFGALGIDVTHHPSATNDSVSWR